MFKFDKGFTHAGSFHADDVFSTAFLRLLNPNIEIIRGFEVPTDFTGIVFDIGNGEFDHHSIPRKSRENGILFAAFGKLWNKYANLIVSDYVKEAIDNELVSYIDDSDNTGKFNSLSSVIDNYNGFWDEKIDLENQNERFFEAVEVAKSILLRYIAKFKSVEKAQRFVLDAYKWSKNGVVILDRYAPWHEILKGTDTRVVVYPSNRGGWNVERIENSGFEFPVDWWGTRNNVVVKGLLFCHASGFMCNFDTYENAIEAVNFVLTDSLML